MKKQRVWQFVWAALAWFAFKSRILKLNSVIHRFLYDRKYAGTPVATYKTVNELANWMAQQKWVGDDWTSLWDAWCTPNKIQAVGQTDGSHEIGDCDEFAIYISAAVEKSLALGTLESGIDRARVLTVMWTDGYKVGGHNVALFSYKQVTDGATWYAYMDYSMPSVKRLTIQQVVQDVRDLYANGSLGLGWAVSTFDMKLEQFRFKG